MSDRELPSVPALLGLSLRDPKATVAVIRALGIPLHAAWMALALSVILGTLLATMSAGVATTDLPQDDEYAAILMLFGNPMILAAMQGGLLALGTVFLHKVAERMGGRGELSDAVAISAWLQFVLVCIQAIQALLLPVAPGLSGLLGLAAVLIFFWLLAQFGTALYGFGSPWLVLGGAMTALLFLAVGMAILYAILILFIGGVPA
ncbi:YIP1 family protein [Roseicyclus sp. F158]|uniref:YIP1 family protein n=1 Tax=Tropicimonas omnivorans TaxID=3075590 RepID=A0ABU3DGV9_9RHOB|nr:YIP1 family protein [Roseicyclus sp. F158]MDT0682922.1 YIP1 family protein [Roseicyclus sp. F158]